MAKAANGNPHTVGQRSPVKPRTARIAQSTKTTRPQISRGAVCTRPAAAAHCRTAGEIESRAESSRLPTVIESRCTQSVAP